MKAPRLTSIGRVTSSGTSRVCVTHESGILSQIHELHDAGGPTDDTMFLVDRAVRITIEPADAPEVEPPHGSALDCLAELKGVLNALIMEHAAAPAADRCAALRRALNLANSASLALLNAQRGKP
jgi:hypothetical protein